MLPPCTSERSESCCHLHTARLGAMLTFLSLKLTFLSLKLTFLSLKLTFLSLKLTVLSIQTGSAEGVDRA
jgi:hypothetical protein